MAEDGDRDLPRMREAVLLLWEPPCDATMYATEPPKTSAMPPHVKSGNGAPLKICVEMTVETLQGLCRSEPARQLTNIESLKPN